jgi:SAM-dependent methyltransferase
MTLTLAIGKCLDPTLTRWVTDQFKTAGVDTVVEGEYGKAEVVDVLPPFDYTYDPGSSNLKTALAYLWQLQGGYRIPLESPGDFYDAAYWARNRCRLFPTAQVGGNVGVGEYHPPAREWHGFAPILEGLWQALGSKPKTLLDIGCGCGSLVAHARRQGVDAVGVDISQHAIEHPAEGAEGHIYLADVRNPGATREAQVVISTDLMEHIHEEHLETLMQSMLALTQEHLAMCICVARRPADVWMHRPGELVPLDRAWIAIAGHTTIMPNSWWRERFAATMEADTHINWEAMHKLAQHFALNPALKAVESWCPANILILSRR